MKKIAYFVLALIVSYSAFASDLDTITQNVKSVCESPSQAGKYWNVTATGKADVTGSIRLASVGVNGEATFTKGEWDGVQQVLKAQQSADNASYRDCAVKLTPLFLAKFAAPVPTAKATESKHYKPKRPAQNKTAASKPPSAKANGSQQETHGDKSPAIITHGDVNVDIK